MEKQVWYSYENPYFRSFIYFALAQTQFYYEIINISSKSVPTCRYKFEILSGNKLCEGTIKSYGTIPISVYFRKRSLMKIHIQISTNLPNVIFTKETNYMKDPKDFDFFYIATLSELS